MFYAGFFFGFVAALAPALAAYYYVFRRLEWALVPPRANVPSGVQVKRAGSRRKPVISDDRKAWEREQEKA